MSAPGWDLLLIQPDTAIPAAGFYDGLAQGGGIAAGSSLGGLSVSFDYLGQGAPGSQVFSIVDPATLTELDSGYTGNATGPVPVPVPGTLVLFALGLAVGAVQCRRQGERK